MQDVIDTDVRRSNQVENYYRECLDKAINRIKRAYEEKQCTQMTLKLGEIAGLKRILPPHSMHDLVKVVRVTAPTLRVPNEGTFGAEKHLEALLDKLLEGGGVKVTPLMGFRLLSHPLSHLGV
jgi:hypothetical protein